MSTDYTPDLRDEAVAIIVALVATALAVVLTVLRRFL